MSTDPSPSTRTQSYHEAKKIDLTEESVIVVRQVSFKDDEEEPLQGNRKAKAHDAFKKGDVEASIMAHENSVENHSKNGEFVKAAVFGGLDGIITTFAVVASVAGADLPVEIVLVMGFANLLADGVSMAFGEFIGGDAEIKYKRFEREREMWEMNNNREGEIKEMVEIYESKGISQEDALTILTTMAKYKDFFVDHMMVQELDLIPAEDEESPLKPSIVIFFSFLIFGLVPLLAYVAFSSLLEKDELFGLSIGLTAIALFTLGAISSRFAAQAFWKSGLFVLANGATAAGVAYLVGYIVQFIVDTEEGCPTLQELMDQTTASPTMAPSF